MRYFRLAAGSWNGFRAPGRFEVVCALIAHEPTFVRAHEVAKHSFAEIRLGVAPKLSSAIWRLHSMVRRLIVSAPTALRLSRSANDARRRVRVDVPPLAWTAWRCRVLMNLIAVRTRWGEIVEVRVARSTL